MSRQKGRDKQSTEANSMNGSVMIVDNRKKEEQKKQEESRLPKGLVIKLPQLPPTVTTFKTLSPIFGTNEEPNLRKINETVYETVDKMMKISEFNPVAMKREIEKIKKYFDTQKELDKQLKDLKKRADKFIDKMEKKKEWNPENPSFALPYGWREDASSIVTDFARYNNGQMAAILMETRPETYRKIERRVVGETMLFGTEKLPITEESLKGKATYVFRYWTSPLEEELEDRNVVLARENEGPFADKLMEELKSITNEDKRWSAAAPEKKMEILDKILNLLIAYTVNPIPAEGSFNIYLPTRMMISKAEDSCEVYINKPPQKVGKKTIPGKYSDFFREPEQLDLYEDLKKRVDDGLGATK